MKKKWLFRILAILLVGVIVIIAAAVGFVYLAPETAARFFLTVERQQAGLERKEIDLPDGTHFVYLEGGTGEPLMLIHGFGANKDSFDRLSKFLTPRYHVVVPDLIGFGESAHPPDADYSPMPQAERLRALAHALGISTLHIGGSSMGGQIALSYAAAHPDEVKSLFLLDSAGAWSAPKSELAGIVQSNGRNPLLVENEDDFAALLPFVMNDPPFIPRPILNVLAQERIKNYALESKIFDQIVADSVEERVRGLSTPTLIVWGEKDRTINVGAADVLHKLLPNSQVIIMPNIGHMPAIESPRETAESYLKFRAAH